MDFTTAPSLSLTVPAGAVTGQARMVIGQDIPPELNTYYGGTNAPYAMHVTAAQLFYNNAMADEYYYIAHLTTDVGSAEPMLGIGVVSAGTPKTVHPRLFLDNSFWANPMSLSVDLWHMDLVTGSNKNGWWTNVALLNGWVPGNPSGPKLQVRRVPAPAGDCELVGVITAPATFNSRIGTVDPPFRPAHLAPVWAWSNTGSGQLVLIQPDGAVIAFGTIPGSSDLWINGTYSLTA